MFRNNDERTDHDLCPRCAVRYMPADYPGALSRTDNETEICSPCGTDEAMLDFTGFDLAVPSEWPVKVIVEFGQ